MNRREFLWQSGGGLGGIALAALEAGATLQATPHFAPRAKRVVQLFMAGAASHVDMFDYKPLLAKHDGKPWDPGESVELFQNGHGNTFASPWKFKQYGQCGKH